MVDALAVAYKKFYLNIFLYFEQEHSPKKMVLRLLASVHASAHDRRKKISLAPASLFVEVVCSSNRGHTCA